MKYLVASVLALTFFSCQPISSGSSQTAHNQTDQPGAANETCPGFLQHLLDSFRLTGTILVYNEAENQFFSNNFPGADTGHLPASTFKIPNTIVALETGVAAGPDHLFKWGGEDRWRDAWEKDLTLNQAFAASCVPCYQEIARAVGPEKMRTELNRLDYPEMKFDSTSVDNFWLRGESRISPKQQIDFLRKIRHDKLPVRRATQKALRDIMVIERTDSHVLSGKTGWTVNGNYNNGWFVGFVELGNLTWYFATNVEPGQGFDMDRFPQDRVIITRLALARLGAFHS